MSTIKLPALPTTNDITTKIRDELAPTPKRLRDIQVAVRKARDSITLPPEELAPLIDAACHGTTPTTDQLIAAATSDSERYQQAEAIRRLNDTHAALISTPSYTPGEESTAVLDYLAECMTALVTYARALPDDLPYTAEDALSDEKNGPTLYRAVQALVSTYGEIRRQQQAAYRNLSGGINPPVYRYTAQFQNATDHEKHWLEQRAKVGAKYGAGIHGTHDDAYAYFVTDIPTAAWGEMTEDHYPDNATGNEGHARWIIWAANNLDLWVPQWRIAEQQHEANTEQVNIDAWINPTTRRFSKVDKFDRTIAVTTTSHAGIETSRGTTIIRNN